MSLRGKNRDAYHIQTNNPTEEMLRKDAVKGWLETCGPTSAVNCLDALGKLPEIVLPGGYRPQAEELLSDWFNDPANYPVLRTARPNLDPASIPGGRVPQYYPVGVMAVFGFPGARFREGFSWEELRAFVRGGGTVQLCLKNPGHYLAAVDVEDEAGAILVNDSWPERWKDGRGGFNRRLTFADWGNLQPWAVFYKEE